MHKPGDVTMLDVAHLARVLPSSLSRLLSGRMGKPESRFYSGDFIIGETLATAQF